MLRVALAGILLAPLVAFAGNITVSDHRHLLVKAGEAQSTVVPPGLKTQCMAGRFLVTDDDRHPPQSGVVTGRNLDQLGAPNVTSSFEEAPGQKQVPGAAVPAGTIFPRYKFDTADHDLVVLTSGDVLYITGAFSRRPTDAAWAADTFRGDFGPNARSVVLIWRSADCGKTFQFQGEIDPVKIEDGSCAMPQFRTDDNGKITSPPWDMGGSDGQLARVDPSNDHVIVTFRCVGYNKKKSSAKFELDPDSPLDKTLVLRSKDAGISWESLGFIEGVNRWRLGVVPIDSKTLAFGWNDAIFFGKKLDANSAKLTYDEPKKAPGGKYGWEHGFPMLGRRDNPYLKALIWARTVTGGLSTGCFIAYPDSAANDGGHGLRLFFFNKATGEFGDAGELIVPAKKGPNNFLFHPVIIDGDDGPPLLYWYDVDWDKKSVTIRGRFITGDGKFTNDFTISKENGGKDRSFKLEREDTLANAYWYGDYQTAGGGFMKSAGTLMLGKTFSYFPMWIEPDDQIHFTRVDFNIPPNMKDLTDVQELTIPRERFTVRPVVLRPSRQIDPDDIEHEQHRRRPPI